MAPPCVLEAEMVKCLETESDKQSEETESLTDTGWLVVRKNIKSKVWKYFRLTPNKDGIPSGSDTPKFRLCLKDYQ